MKGFRDLILSGIFLGTIGVFVKLIGSDVSPFLLGSIRILAAAALIYLFLAAERRTKLLKLWKGDLHIFLIAGILGVVLGFGFFVRALTLIPVANAIFLVFIYPIITAILARIFLKESLGKYTIIALALSLAGIFLIYGMGATIAVNIEGSLYALIAGFGYAVFIVSMRYMEKKGHSFWDAVFWPLMLGGLMLLPLNLTDTLVFTPSFNTLIWIVGMIFISTFLPYTLYARGLETIQAKHATIIETLAEPAAAIFLAWIILGEMVPEYIFLGGALIILANLIVRLDLVEESHRKRI